MPRGQKTTGTTPKGNTSPTLATRSTARRGNGNSNDNGVDRNNNDRNVEARLTNGGHGNTDRARSITTMSGGAGSGGRGRARGGASGVGGAGGAGRAPDTAPDDASLLQAVGVDANQVPEITTQTTHQGVVNAFENAPSLHTYLSNLGNSGTGRAVGGGNTGSSTAARPNVGGAGGGTRELFVAGNDGANEEGYSSDDSAYYWIQRRAQRLGRQSAARPGDSNVTAPSPRDNSNAGNAGGSNGSGSLTTTGSGASRGAGLRAILDGAVQAARAAESSRSDLDRIFENLRGDLRWVTGTGTNGTANAAAAGFHQGASPSRGAGGSSGSHGAGGGFGATDVAHPAPDQGRQGAPPPCLRDNLNEQLLERPNNAVGNLISDSSSSSSLSSSSSSSDLVDLEGAASMIANLGVQINAYRAEQGELDLAIQRVGEEADVATAMANAALEAADRLNNRVDGHEQRIAALEQQRQHQESDDDVDDA